MTLQLGLTEEQKAQRKNRIGASNTPGILRLSPWSSPIQEWAKIVEPESVEQVMTDAMKAGLLFEPQIIRWFEDEHGHKAAPGWTMQHPMYRFIVATPDAVVRDETLDCDIPLECKFVSPRQAERWKVDGVYQAPSYVRAQHLHQQMVMSVNRGWIIACVNSFEGVKFHAELVESSDEERGHILRTLVDFYLQHIDTQVPPMADASAGATSVLTKLHPKSNGKLIEATADDRAMLLMRDVLAQQERELKQKRDELENQMRQRIGDAEGIEGVARWSNRAGTIAYAKAAKAAGLDDEFLAKFRGESSRVLKWEVA